MNGIPLHRARFAIGPGAYVDLESAIGWPGGSAAPALDKRMEAEVESAPPAQVNSGGIPPMRWLESGALFEPFQLREDSDYFVDVTLPITVAEARQRAGGDSGWPFDPQLQGVFERDPPRRWKEQNENGVTTCTITGVLRLRSHAGVMRLATDYGAIFAEVVCRKLTYFEEFKALLEDLAASMAELLLAYDSPVALSFVSDERIAENDAALHFQMRHIMAASRLPLAAQEILTEPHVRLIEYVARVPLESAEDPDFELVADGLDIDTLSPGGPLARFFRGVTPRELPQREMVETTDTPENRYAKAILENCRLIASRILNRMRVSGKPAAAREAATWERELNGILEAGFWRGVGTLEHIPSNSQVLLRKRGYKDLLQFDIELRLALTLPWTDGVNASEMRSGDARPVDQLYEYWCFLSLYQLLEKICRRESGGDFISVTKDGLRVQLKKGRQSEARFIFSDETGSQARVSLFYNRSFRRPANSESKWLGSYSSVFKPDISIMVQAENPAGLSTQLHWLHFDAKYRLDRTSAENLFGDFATEVEALSEGGTSSYTEEMIRVHKLDDLYKMHTYRDGILSSRGAYVLFPGDTIGANVSSPGRNLFVRNPASMPGPPHYRLPSVGTFGLTPIGTDRQRGALQDFLHSAFASIASGFRYEEETGYFGR